MALSLANKHAIVPGGSRGIGLAIAQELARRGASVLITYVSSPSRAETAVAEIKKCAVAGAKVSSIKADSADSAAAADLVVEGAHDLFETIDIIINNAADGSDVSLEQVTTENFDHLFHANLLFPLLLCKASKKYLRQGARIVNISSTSARRRKLPLSVQRSHISLTTLTPISVPNRAHIRRVQSRPREHHQDARLRVRPRVPGDRQRRQPWARPDRHVERVRGD
jgi:NAD(P)-dependent dehydrogenase (short-subunit alcohol dehydrogenase family)